MKFLHFTVFFAAILSTLNAFALDINDENVKNAIKNNDIEAMETFIAQGFDVNSRDKDGNTPLYIALRQKRLEIAKKMIDAGADVNAPSAQNGMTPLIIATSMADRLQIKATEIMNSSEGYAQSRANEIKLKKYIMHQMNIAQKMLIMLIEQGADINQETPMGTPLISAVSNAWNTDLIDILIKSGANVNARDRKGRTALFYGEIFGGDTISTKLLAAGADVDIKDNSGKNYLEVTKEELIEN
ncbi:MAG: ankyrin repeat domain-containing protein [Alphaproteobacteria bacterium]|nr:ankyrin repeat domain-containing protein [Alphaproteobacteria bacterium]